jgi:hypothetical protein
MLSHRGQRTDSSHERSLDVEHRIFDACRNVRIRSQMPHFRDGTELSEFFRYRYWVAAIEATEFKRMMTIELSQI